MDSEKNLEVFASDPIGLTEALGLQGSRPDGELAGVRVVDDHGLSFSLDICDDGKVSVRTEGNGISGRADEVRTCQIVVDRLNSEGEHWENAERMTIGHENGIDVIAKHLYENTQLNFQVTRVDPDQRLWRDLAKKGAAEKDYTSVDNVADAIYEAIDRKRGKPQEGIILVLNATQLQIGLPSVRESFAKRHGAWLRELKFDEVWVVGSFHDKQWTCRLSPKSLP
jgi:hypothetical protein